MTDLSIIDRIKRGQAAKRLADDPTFNVLMAHVDAQVITDWRNLGGRGDFQIRSREEMHAKLIGFAEIRSVLEGWQADGEVARQQRDGLDDNEGEE
jgi:hypothetical protein